MRASLTTPEDLRPEYLAFVSYRHLDNQQLESYEIPEDLTGTPSERWIRLVSEQRWKMQPRCAPFSA